MATEKAVVVNCIVCAGSKFENLDDFGYTYEDPFDDHFEWINHVITIYADQIAAQTLVTGISQISDTEVMISIAPIYGWDNQWIKYELIEIQTEKILLHSL